ncbi:hypothetical protein B0J12DRAFT_740375 [Macrophomina phaseolina]|uniref:Uncharacterized protein n=1 Tax=Macrophomina phaseolina TaxID=35725 RepID=A0ABQ8GAH4_9PEZI|nr:hypothetical protein B0J12DRAFT_740375 [Macrophomina phaseolina]
MGSATQAKAAVGNGVDDVPQQSSPLRSTTDPRNLTKGTTQQSDLSLPGKSVAPVHDHTYSLASALENAPEQSDDTSSQPTESSVSYDRDAGYNIIFQGRRISCVVASSSVIPADVKTKMFGVSAKTFEYLEQVQDVPSDYDRPAVFPTWDNIPDDMKIYNVDDAAQYMQRQVQRDAPYQDDTYAPLRANDAQNAINWYNDIVDLSEMEDGLHSNAAHRFTKMHRCKKLKQDIAHYDVRALAGLYFILMDALRDGHHNGFVRTTNKRQQKLIDGKGMATNMTAEERVSQMRMCVKARKSTVSDLLGPNAKDNILDFIYCPLAYLKLKRGDHKINEARKVDSRTRNAARLQRLEDIQTKTNEELAAADNTIWRREWSALPAGQRPLCLYPSWQDLDASQQITTPAAAHQYFASLDVREPIPPEHDPQLEHVIQMKHLIGRWLYNCLAHVADAQDNASSNPYAQFVGGSPGADPSADEPTLRHWGYQVRNMQAWCYLLADRHVDASVAGRLVPRTDGTSEAEFRRSGKAAELATVMYGDRHAFVNVFERVGATGIVLMREKSLAAGFLGVRETDLRMRELVYEPFAFMHTRGAHRRSNATRKRKAEKKRKDERGPGNDDDDDGDGQGGGPCGSGQGGRTRKRDDDDNGGSGPASKRSRRTDRKAKDVVDQAFQAMKMGANQASTSAPREQSDSSGTTFGKKHMGGLHDLPPNPASRTPIETHVSASQAVDWLELPESKPWEQDKACKEILDVAAPGSHPDMDFSLLMPDTEMEESVCVPKPGIHLASLLGNGSSQQPRLPEQGLAAQASSANQHFYGRQLSTSTLSIPVPTGASDPEQLAMATPAPGQLASSLDINGHILPQISAIAPADGLQPPLPPQDMSSRASQQHGSMAPAYGLQLPNSNMLPYAQPQHAWGFPAFGQSPSAATAFSPSQPQNKSHVLNFGLGPSAAMSYGNAQPQHIPIPPGYVHQGVPLSMNGYIPQQNNSLAPCAGYGVPLSNIDGQTQPEQDFMFAVPRNVLPSAPAYDGHSSRYFPQQQSGSSMSGASEQVHKQDDTVGSATTTTSHDEGRAGAHLYPSTQPAADLRHHLAQNISENHNAILQHHQSS